ncbi:MAG: hypothetical protein AABY22_29265 [Nanoarchaeota archaeon]
MTSMGEQISKSRLYKLWKQGRVVSLPKPKTILGKAILKFALFLLRKTNEKS